MPVSSGHLIDTLQAELFGESDTVFAVLDGAAVPDLLHAMYSLKPKFECLYRGDLEPDMAEVAPYLVQLQRGAPFATWLMLKGVAKPWGIFASSKEDLASLRRHFRRFLTVHDETGKPMLFRFYDPRVLKSYLPSCEAAQRKAFFGNVERYMTADEPELTSFSLAPGDGSLRKEVRRL